MYVLLDSKPSKVKNGDYPLLLLAACSETYSDASKENVEQREIKKIQFRKYRTVNRSKLWTKWVDSFNC